MYCYKGILIYYNKVRWWYKVVFYICLYFWSYSEVLWYYNGYWNIRIEYCVVIVKYCEDMIGFVMLKLYRDVILESCNVLMENDNVIKEYCNVLCYIMLV